MKKLFSRYNQKDSLLVISTYPKKGQVYATGMGGVASFTKNTLAPLASRGQKIVVLANKINGKKEIYQEGNILVIRCWQRGSASLFGDLIREIRKFREIREILIEFEFALYDGLWKTLFFPFFFLILKLWGKKTILVLHQVIFDLSQLSGHLGWKKQSLTPKVFSLGIKTFYWLMALFTNKVVVLEEEFKKRLVDLGITQNKVEVIPHGVDIGLKPISQAKAKKALGFSPQEKIVLVFGFLTWYKGSDLILKQFKKFIKQNPKTKLRLILAGGESQTQKNKPHYQQYLKRLHRLAKSCPQAEITGFVPEEKISLYFPAADWVVLPYRTFMSSSGPLSLAITFGRPVLVSRAYSKILNTPDFKNEIKLAGLKRNDLIWQGFDQLPSKAIQTKIKKMVRQIRQQRNFNKLGEKYLGVIEEPAVKTLPSPAPQPAAATI